MGSAQSAAARTQRGSKKARIKVLREKQAEVDLIDKRLHALKIHLYRTRVEGIMQRDKQEEELYRLNTEEYKRRSDLLKKGKEASKAVPFQEYLNIARNPGKKGLKKNKAESTDKATIDSNKSMKANGAASSKCTATSPPAKDTKTTTTAEQPKASRFSTAIMLRNFNFPLANTLFSYMEAYLLKRLHMAMLQEHQQKIHSESWSSNVSKLYTEIDPLKQESKDVKSKLSKKVGFQKEYNEGLQKIYEDHIKQQELIIYRYEQAPYTEPDVPPEDIDESYHMA